MKLDNLSKQIYFVAKNEAMLQRHKYITPEHVLHACLCFDAGKMIVRSAGGNVEKIQKEIVDFFDHKISKSTSKEPIETVAFNFIFDVASINAVNAGKKDVSVDDLILAIFAQKESYSVFLLEKYGATKLNILRYVTQGLKSDKVKDDEYYKRLTFIKNYTVEMTQKALEGAYHPLIGREELLQDTILVLCRKQKSNPVHVGDPGTGKTAIVEGLANLIVQDQVPDLLKGSKIYSLDMGAIIAGTKYRGDFEERLKTLLEYISAEEKSIIYIDEIHTVVGAGEVSGGAMDASNILKPYLTRGALRFIGSTTYEEYKRYFEKDRALSRRFQKIDVPEPSIQESITILEGVISHYEDYHNVTYTKDAVKAACQLSDKYILDRFLPDKALDVIDLAGATVGMKVKRKKIEINVSDIQKVVARIGKTPIENVTLSESKKLLNLEQQLSSIIFGQKEAVEKTVNAIKRSRSGITDKNKPVASLLFVGPTGVGKTELANQLALLQGIKLLRFDMSEYQEKHAVARLIGSPPGYVGYEDGGLLTDSIRKTPHCVLLLDEIEKAHEDILNVLLQIMDYGSLTDNTGKKADFKNVILIMTSNAGARDINKNIIGFGAEKNLGAIHKEVDRFFSPEFRNRLDNIVVFQNIDTEIAAQIVQKGLDQFRNILKEKNISLRVMPGVVSWIVERGYREEFGAREINRVIEQEIKGLFVDRILFGDLSGGGIAYLSVKKGQISLSVKNK